jgi:hypothetical protein
MYSWSNVAERTERVQGVAKHCWSPKWVDRSVSRMGCFRHRVYGSLLRLHFFLADFSCRGVNIEMARLWVWDILSAQWADRGINPGEHLKALKKIQNRRSDLPIYFQQNSQEIMFCHHPLFHSSYVPFFFKTNRIYQKFATPPTSASKWKAFYLGIVGNILNLRLLQPYLQ